MIATFSMPTLANIFSIFITGIDFDSRINNISLDFGFSACGIFTIISMTVFLILMHYYKNAVANIETQFQDFYNKSIIYPYLIYFTNLIFVFVATVINIPILIFQQQLSLNDTLAYIISGFTGFLCIITLLVLLYINLNILILNKKEN